MRPACVFHVPDEPLPSPPGRSGRSGGIGRPDHGLRRRIGLGRHQYGRSESATRRERAGEAGEDRRLRSARLRHPAARQCRSVRGGAAGSRANRAGRSGGLRLPRWISPTGHSDGEEQGLLSIAFAPDFQTSGLVYAYYTGNDQDQHVVGFTVRDDGSFGRASERELLHMDDFASNHNGGLLLFGPDRQLYIGTGDGGAPTIRSATAEPRLAARQDPADRPRRRGGRPYTVQSQPVRRRRGARPRDLRLRPAQPVAILLRPQHGRAADRRRRPEHAGGDRLRPGGPRSAAATSAGRPSRAPTASTTDQTAPDAVFPVLTYSHDEGGCSVTGGYVVRDRSLPALFGRYVYGDFCVGELRSFKPATPQAQDDRSLGLKVPSLSSFGQDK